MSIDALQKEELGLNIKCLKAGKNKQQSVALMKKCVNKSARGGAHSDSSDEAVEMVGVVGLETGKAANKEMKKNQKVFDKFKEQTEKETKAAKKAAAKAAKKKAKAAKKEAKKAKKAVKAVKVQETPVRSARTARSASPLRQSAEMSILATLAKTKGVFVGDIQAMTKTELNEMMDVMGISEEYRAGALEEHSGEWDMDRELPPHLIGVESGDAKEVRSQRRSVGKAKTSLEGKEEMLGRMFDYSPKSPKRTKKKQKQKKKRKTKRRKRKTKLKRNTKRRN